MPGGGVDLSGSVAKNTLPSPGRAAYAHLAALRLHDALGEREAESRARILLGRAGVELLELDEEAPEVLRRDTDAGVLDLEAEVSAPSGATRTETRPPSGVNFSALER